MSPRLTQPFVWTHENEEYSGATQTGQVATNYDTKPHELEGPQNSMAFEIEATPATSSLPIPTAAALQAHTPCSYGSKISYIQNAEVRGSRSRTLQPTSLPPVSEESAVDTEIEVVPRRTSRSYAVSGTSLVGSGPEEVRQHREARRGEEKRRLEQADRAIAEDLQQEELIRNENERWQQKERRQRADAAMAQQLRDDEEDVSDDGYIWVKNTNGERHPDHQYMHTPDVATAIRRLTSIIETLHVSNSGTSTLRHLRLFRSRSSG